MKQVFTFLLTLVIMVGLNAQNASIIGTLKDDSSNPVEFVNVVLYRAADSSMVKVETTDKAGAFRVQGLEGGEYWLEASYVGLENLYEDLTLEDGMELDLDVLTMNTLSVELDEAVITAKRSIVEIKADRTVFNVEGTINSSGDDALNLLRKAPGVLVDNNDNITVLSRSGVMVYLDGKRLPLSGDELANYLKTIPAEQIDHIDIITNPGAKYEAEGTAGIIDIRLKRDKGLGANGTLSSTYSQGQYGRGNINGLGNYRNKTLNAFGQFGYNGGTRYNEMNFSSTQNGFASTEVIQMKNYGSGYNYRVGTDFFIKKNHTVGFLVGGNHNDRDGSSYNRMEIGREGSDGIDSILVANNTSIGKSNVGTYNLNYAFNNKKTTVNIDADYGRYRNDNNYIQPNTYYDPSEEIIISERNTAYDTDNSIDIYTFLVDVETDLWGGKLGFGSKLSQVGTDNKFLFYDIPDDEPIFNDARSNIFVYEENVYAGYLNYARPIGEKWSFSAGLRLEQTDTEGDLEAFKPELEEPPVVSNYLNAFPSAGLTYSIAPEHSLALNYGRRINRPDYNVLNPFRVQLSELSYRKGNPFLKPEIVNNLELGYTLKYMYNFKLSYSHTTDKITRLIGPDDENPLAGFITWDNLADQKIYALNIAAPVEITKKWNAFFNVSGSYIDNQADYGDNGIVDVQVWTYTIYQQHTFDLPWKLTAEVSGYFSGPGVWGGVFLYEETWSLNLGLQRRFFNEKLNVRMTANDIFNTQGWSGTSDFNGLVASGNGQHDSRRGTVSLSYNFGNKNVKSRKRKTGLEQEAKRVSNE